jgi:ferredoxin/bacterioferritin-associated ferredoxin
MKLITLVANVNADLCHNCQTCPKVCPTLAISMVKKKAVVDPRHCIACGNCTQRCDRDAITLNKLETPRTVSVSTEDVPTQELEALCRKAGFHPSQIICYCSATRAEEIGAAIMKGAESPEELSRLTGIRGGCSVECIQPMLRLLQAAGITPTPPKDGWQWYGLTPTLADIPESIKAKYRSRGFCFDEDQKLFDSVINSERS